MDTGIIGIIIGSLSLFISGSLGVLKLREYFPFIRVSKSSGRLIINDKNSEPMEIFTAQNKSNISVVITGCGFLGKNKIKYHLLNPYQVTFPYTIEPRRKLEIFYGYRWFNEASFWNDIKGFFFRDEEEHTWKIKISKKEKRKWGEAEITGFKLQWNPQTKRFIFEE